MPGKVEWTTRRLLALAAVELVLAALAAVSMDRNEGFPRYLGLYLAMSLPWLAASYVAVREREVRRSDAALVLGVAALLRVFFLAADPVLSDDIFRYVWDGRVQRSG